MTKNEVLNKLGNFKGVCNLTSDGGMAITNQFKVTFENGYLFQSYNSIIFVKIYQEDIIYLGDDWDYSRTTTKYRNMLLDEDTKEIRKLLAKDEKYKLIDGLQ